MERQRFAERHGGRSLQDVTGIITAPAAIGQRRGWLLDVRRMPAGKHFQPHSAATDAAAAKLSRLRAEIHTQTWMRFVVVRCFTIPEPAICRALFRRTADGGDNSHSRPTIGIPARRQLAFGASQRQGDGSGGDEDGDRTKAKASWIWKRRGHRVDVARGALTLAVQVQGGRA